MRTVVWVFLGIIATLVIYLVTYWDLDLGLTKTEFIFQNHTVYVQNVTVLRVNAENVTEPCPQPPPRPSRIKHLEITERDDDTSSDWNDDDGTLRMVTIMYNPNIDDLQWIRRFVGSVHYFENEKMKVTIFGYKVPEDIYLELRTFALVRFVNLLEKDAMSLDVAQKYVAGLSRSMYQRFIYIDLGLHVMFHASGLAKEVNEATSKGKITMLLNDAATDRAHGYILGEGDGIQIKLEKYLQLLGKDVDEGHGRCTLLRNLTSPYRTKYLFSYDNDNFLKKEDRHSPDDKLVCLSIATYSGSHPMEPEEFSLLKFVLPSFLESTKDEDKPESRYRFAMYLGVQRDPNLYDDPTKMEYIKQKIITATKDRAFSLRIFYTPLNAPALDITYKWNVLIDQSYRDGCDYIYQYSDDTIFTTPWADYFIRYLEAESNFGVIGATDSLNPGTMTLGFAHRSHVEIMGSFWPSHLKNWYSDNWHQTVYGQRYTHHSTVVRMQNTQHQGQRYPACGAHGELMQNIMKDESRPRIIEWLKKQPQTYDIRRKLGYFVDEQAQGAKKR